MGFFGILKGKSSLSTEQLIKNAISSHKTITFNYKGQRRAANPHALFMLRKKDGKTSAKIHAIQIAGYSKSGAAGWRMFNVSDISDVKIESGTFYIDSTFNPSSKFYRGGFIIQN